MFGCCVSAWVWAGEFGDGFGRQSGPVVGSNDWARLSLPALRIEGVSAVNKYLENRTPVLRR